MPRAPGVVLLPIALLLGCASRPRAESPPHVEVASAAPAPPTAAPPDGAPAAVVAEPDAQRPAPCAPLVWTSSACQPADPRPEPMSGELLAKWYADRGARAPTEDLPPQCYERSVGPGSEPALVCERMTQPFEKASGGDVFRVLLRYVIVAVRKGRAVTLFDRPYYVEILDKERLEQGPLFALAVDVSANGSEVLVRELAPHACADATAFLHEREKEATAETDEGARASILAWTRFDRKMLARTCASVGRYTWSAGAFVRAP